jgi:hypothetical protein
MCVCVCVCVCVCGMCVCVCVVCVCVCGMCVCVCVCVVCVCVCACVFVYRPTLILFVISSVSYYLAYYLYVYNYYTCIIIMMLSVCVFLCAHWTLNKKFKFQCKFCVDTKALIQSRHSRELWLCSLQTPSLETVSSSSDSVMLSGRLLTTF